MSDDSKTGNGNSAPTAGTDEVGGVYARYVLVVLLLVYVFNFLDRQIISILAEDIKADLGISDSQIGFLYGTAFALFYAVFGIPLARLADVWTRKSLISIGLFFWSAMTALSGTARSMFSLSAYRIGVGVGEASASPAAFSMIGDYFSPKVRATALAVYSSGIYIGAGIGLFLGGWIVDSWARLYPDGDSPFGLAGWQAAYIAVGLPGLFMAVWVWTLREPIRGMSEGIPSKPPHPHPFRVFAIELSSVIPPFTLWSLWRAGAGRRALLVNCCMGALSVLGAAGLIALLGSKGQWIALGIGTYAFASWLQALAIRDPAAFTMIFRSKALVFGTTGFALIAFKGYGVGFWVPPYLMRAHGASASQVGLVVGISAATAGWLGITLGGIISDRLKRKTPYARMYLGFAAIVLSVPVALVLLLTENLTIAYIAAFFNSLVAPLWIASAIALNAELVPPRMRATATAFYVFMTAFVGLALGPYTMGRLSDWFERGGAEPADALRSGILSGFVSLIGATVCLLIAMRYVASEEKDRFERARAAGEPET